MLVGAVMPRQKTAFASEEPRIRAAAKDTRAAPSKMNTRMGFFSEIASLCMGLLPQAKKSFQVDRLSSSQTDQSPPVGFASQNFLI
jgi:hypothetical protein